MGGKGSEAWDGTSHHPGGRWRRFRRRRASARAPGRRDYENELEDPAASERPREEDQYAILGLQLLAAQIKEEERKSNQKKGQDSLEEVSSISAAWTYLPRSFFKKI
jgi:hypothetical protein